MTCSGAGEWLACPNCVLTFYPRNEVLIVDNSVCHVSLVFNLFAWATFPLAWILKWCLSSGKIRYICTEYKLDSVGDVVICLFSWVRCCNHDTVSRVYHLVLGFLSDLDMILCRRGCKFSIKRECGWISRPIINWDTSVIIRRCTCIRFCLVCSENSCTSVWVDRLTLPVNRGAWRWIVCIS